MNKRRFNTLQTTGLWLFTSFLIFSILGYTALTKGKASTGTLIFTCSTLALLVSVVLLVAWLLKKQYREAGRLREKLEERENENNSLVRELEKNIEERIYELQKVNGALNREIAERIQAESEVRELQKQLALILNSAGEGILGLDNTGKVTFLNSAASLMLGWEPEEIIGRKHHSLIHHTLPDGTPHPVDQCPIYMAYRDGLVHYRTGDVFWCKNGTSFPVEYSSTPINDQGMLTGAVVVFRDMSTFT